MTIAAHEATPSPEGRFATVADRREGYDQLALLIRSTVSAPRMAVDATVVVGCALLVLTASVVGAPLLQWYALGGAAVWAVLRLHGARRAAVDFVARADEPATMMSPEERGSLPPSLMAPCDARTLAELDAIVRALHAPPMRVLPWIASVFYMVALALLIAAVVSIQDTGASELSAALLGIAAAACVPVGVWTTFVWANQRAIEAVFRQVDAVIENDALPVGELPDDAAVRLGDDGRVVVVRERLRRSFRPRTRPARRPSVAPALVVSGMLAASALCHVVFVLV
ncbi:hypothetical protein [Microbacterium enclense]|uniref:hypothetical protein n=1 Tax=Microbacterium enclense TaxID=993073 RepID=UPI00343A67FE